MATKKRSKARQVTARSRIGSVSRAGRSRATPIGAATLDLGMAWERLKLDRPNRCFVPRQHAISWIEADLSGWLDGLDAEIRRGYVPRDCQGCAVPKGNWMVRPGAVLDIRDEVVFDALVGSFHANLWAAIGWAQGDPDTAYQLQSSPKKVKWVRSGVPIWTEFRTRSLRKLSKSHYVVVSDIAGFYENIDLGRLASDLRAIEPEQAVLDLLMACLHRWARPRGKGIPQGHTASDLLAKLYLEPVDRGLKDAGMRHLRYVDDIRVFCKSSLEAKKALLTLDELVRAEGLNLQGAKTQVVRADQAQKIVDGVSPLIERIQRELGEELRRGATADEYSGVTVSDIAASVERDPDSPTVAVLERAFQDHLLAATEFDKTLFHYLLTRLGRVGSRKAVNYCLDLIPSRPEETEPILRYLEEVGVDEKEEAPILEYMASPEAIYDYQLYELVEWFGRRHHYPQDLLRLSRVWSFDRNRDAWLRTAALEIVAVAGNRADLTKTEKSYTDAASELEKAEIARALRRTEKGRRNEFYGRIKNDGELVGRAIGQVRDESRKR